MTDPQSPVQMFLDVLADEDTLYAIENYAPTEIKEDEKLNDLLQALKQSEAELWRAITAFKQEAERQGYEIDYM